MMVNRRIYRWLSYARTRASDTTQQAAHDDFAIERERL